jgi:multidrug transporter EmrE-like cation transporter
MEIDIILLAAVVTGVTQAVKLALGEKVKRFIPLIAIAIGLGISSLLFMYADMTTVIVRGIVLGLGATGLFENLNKVEGLFKK